MADQSASQRTEQATPQRVKKARDEGQIAQSQELPSALMIAVLLAALALMAGGLLDWFVSELRSGLAMNAVASLDADSYGYLLTDKASSVMRLLLPFAIVGAVASVASGLLVGGWAFSPKAARMDLNRIDAIKGFKNLFSAKSLMTLVSSLVKLGVLGWIIWRYVSGRMSELLAMRWVEPLTLLGQIARLVGGLVGRVAIALAAIAIADWLFQKWNYKRQLRMTKDEVKQERRNQEMSPQMRGHMRGVQLEMARKRMLQEVPRADVVIVNPTHVAVALKYRAGAMDAPQLLAKGPDLLCEKIKDIARAHKVPIVHRPELARTIYATVEVGQPIPETLFVAVAEVLAMIYRARRQGNTVG